MNTKPAHTSAWVPEWSFGDRMRKVRTELGYDQREFAEKLDIKAPTLSSYEAGRANPRAKDLPVLATKLEMLSNVPRAWFMGWETENPHPDNPSGGMEPPAGIDPATFSLQVRRLAPVTPLRVAA